MDPRPDIPVTQTDIALAAGVHRTTVSMALRSHPRIPEATRLRILAVAETLGYKPNPLVNALMSQVRLHRPPCFKGALALLNPWHSKGGWSVWECNRRMVEGARERAAAAGFHLEEYWLGDPSLSASRLHAILLARGVLGVLVLQPQEPTFEIDFDFSSFACASVGLSCRRPVLPVAQNHQYDSLLRACQALRNLDYRRIALWVYEGHNERVNRLWTAAFSSYQLGIPETQRLPPLLLSSPGEVARLPGYLRDFKPDAILASDVALAEPLGSLGLRFPQDLGFALLDKEPANQNFAGVDQRHQQAGAAAIDLICGALYRNETGLPTDPQVLLTLGSWCPGPSVRQT